MHPDYDAMSSQVPPKVIFWQKMYCWGLALMYLMVGLGFLILLPLGIEADDGEMIAYGVMLPLVSLPLAIACVVAAFLPRKPWVWMVHLVVLILTVSSCCLPFALPLLLNWFKQETKDWYGA